MKKDARTIMDIYKGQTEMMLQYGYLKKLRSVKTMNAKNNCIEINNNSIRP